MQASAVSFGCLLDEKWGSWNLNQLNHHIAINKRVCWGRTPRLEKTLARKRVLIVKNANILGAAIESLLEGYCQHEIKTILINDQQAIEKELDLFRPDIVITDEKTILTHLLGIAECMQAYPSLRLVILNPENNKVQVFDKHQFQIQEIKDFLSVL